MARKREHDEPRRRVAGEKHAPLYHQMFEISEIDNEEINDLCSRLHQTRGCSAQAVLSLRNKRDELTKIVWGYVSSVIAYAMSPSDREIAKALGEISNIADLSPRLLQMKFFPKTVEGPPPPDALLYEIAIQLIEDYLATSPFSSNSAQLGRAEAIKASAQHLAEEHKKSASAFRANKKRDDMTIHAISQLIFLLESSAISTSLPGNSELEQVGDRALYRSAQWLLEVTLTRIRDVGRDLKIPADLDVEIRRYQNILPSTFTRDLRRAKRLAKALSA